MFRWHFARWNFSLRIFPRGIFSGKIFSSCNFFQKLFSCSFPVELFTGEIFSICNSYPVEFFRWNFFMVGFFSDEFSGSIFTWWVFWLRYFKVWFRLSGFEFFHDFFCVVIYADVVIFWYQFFQVIFFKAEFIPCCKYFLGGDLSGLRFIRFGI